MSKKTQKLGILLELVNLITLTPSDNPAAQKYENRKCRIFAHDAADMIPCVSYQVFTELMRKLDQNGATFEAYLARQISNLYFLLRLAPVLNKTPKKPVERRVSLLTGEEPEEVVDLFPQDLLENGPYASANQLLVNYLTESWNRYQQAGPTRNRREAIAIERLYYLVLEVVRTCGWWTWPFFYHHESLEHVDRMTKLVEEAGDGRIPFAAGQDRGDLWPDVLWQDRGDDEAAETGPVCQSEGPATDSGHEVR